MIDLLTDELLHEEQRIREAYGKRKDRSRYSSFNAAQLLNLQELERRFLALLKQHGFQTLNTKGILEIGCGTGYWLREFVKWGAHPQNLRGVELLLDRAQEARRSCPNGVQVECANACNLSFPDSSFDLVFQATVFTSVLDQRVKQKMAFEMLRVLKADGLIIWYDFYVRHPLNPDVCAIGREEIYRLFPQCKIDLCRVTLAPPVARVVAPYSWLACYLLERVRLLNTHYLGVIRKS